VLRGDAQRLLEQIRLRHRVVVEKHDELGRGRSECGPDRVHLALLCFDEHLRSRMPRDVDLIRQRRLRIVVDDQQVPVRHGAVCVRSDCKTRSK
jgi:hypothetical protein